jgi:hypothetical protein
MVERRMRYIGNSKRRIGGKNNLMATQKAYVKRCFCLNLMVFVCKKLLGIEARVHYVLAVFYAACILKLNSTGLLLA